MVGRYKIEIYDSRVHYELDIKRNITILQGDSGIGKSVLVGLVREYANNPDSSGITLKCDKPCYELTELTWRYFTQNYHNCIFFIDEEHNFFRTKEFADVVKRSDAYYIIICREPLKELAYSVNEIYTLGSESNKYPQSKQVYSTQQEILNFSTLNYKIDLIITEDTNSGYDFYKNAISIPCVSAGGKSNIENIMRQNCGKSILVVADGAAFGCEVQKCVDHAKGRNIAFFLPESFEWVILKSGIFDIPNQVINETWSYAETTKYFSWERFYTYYLSDITQNNQGQYSKRRLSPFYLTEGNKAKIRAILPAFVYNGPAPSIDLFDKIGG